MTDTQLHNLLSENEYTLAVVRDETVVAWSREKGLKPLYELYRERPELLKGATVADKVTGKAAAMLAIMGGAQAVYSDLVSDHALEVLEKHPIQARYLKKVPYIINRTKTGMCPMEQLVLDAAAPQEGVRILTEFFDQLANRAGTSGGPRP